MRDRAWRRYIEDHTVVKRLKKLNYHNSWYFHAFKDANGISHRMPIPFDYVGTYDIFTYKTHTTKWNRSRYKSKYSPNKNKHRYRDRGSLKTREEQDRVFLRILKEYGIK